MQSESIKELATALAKAQAELKPVVADSEADAGKYGYKWARLDNVYRATIPILSTHGLSVSQGVDFEGDTTFVHTILMHESGEWRDSRLPFKVLPNPQDTGSLISYYKRYSWLAMIGLPSTDEDDDAYRAKMGDKEEQKKAQDAAFEVLRTALSDIDALAHLRNWWKKHQAEINTLPKAQQVELLGMGDVIKKKSQEQTVAEKPKASPAGGSPQARVNILITGPALCKKIDELELWWVDHAEEIEAFDGADRKAVEAVYDDQLGKLKAAAEKAPPEPKSSRVNPEDLF